MPDFPPAIPLKGGPYNGLDTAKLSGREMPEHGVAFFPDRLHVSGPDGTAVYSLDFTDEGPVGKYDKEGK